MIGHLSDGFYNPVPCGLGELEAVLKWWRTRCVEGGRSVRCASLSSLSEFQLKSIIHGSNQDLIPAWVCQRRRVKTYA